MGRRSRGYITIEASIYIPIAIYVTFILLLAGILMIHCHITSISAMEETGTVSERQYCYDSSAPGFEYSLNEIHTDVGWYNSLDSGIWGGNDTSKSLIGEARSVSGFGSTMGPVSYIYVDRSLSSRNSSFLKTIFESVGNIRVGIGYGSAVSISPVEYSRKLDAAHYYTRAPGGKSLSMVLACIHKTGK